MAKLNGGEEGRGKGLRDRVAAVSLSGAGRQCEAGGVRLGRRRSQAVQGQQCHHSEWSMSGGEMEARSLWEPVALTRTSRGQTPLSSQRSALHVEPWSQWRPSSPGGSAWSPALCQGPWPWL